MGPILGNIPSHIAKWMVEFEGVCAGSEIHGSIGPHLALKVCAFISGLSRNLYVRFSPSHFRSAR